MSDELTIGELARTTGVATSALRYWEEQGLVAPDRVAGRRRYPASAVRLVGLILILRDIGFTLREIRPLVSPHSEDEAWRNLHQRKLAELDVRIAEAQAARTAIAHALACPHHDIHDCPNFNDGITARLAGSSLLEAHRLVHVRNGSRARM